MTDLTELRMNVAALKRVDPYVKDILETATHVALYTFNANNNEWEKTDIEGALFVYSRNGEPYNSVLIMNRLNTNNLVEPVTQGLDLQLQEPFLLYRNSKGSIYGIWFYDKEECIHIAAMLTKLVKESEESRRTGAKPIVNKGKRSIAGSTNNIDIFSMLSKAQEDFNTSRGSGGGGSSGNSTGCGVGSKSPANASSTDNVTGPLSAPLGLDVTSQSVMDFFAKAKVNTGHFKAGDQPTSGSVVANEGKPLLARLMSHPAAHTLENIEKQHRSVTPQPSTGQQGQPATGIPGAAMPIANNDLSLSTSQNVNDTNGSAGFLRIQSPTTTVSSNLTNHQGSSIIPSSNSNPLTSLFAHASNTGSDDIIGAPPLSATGSAPALIPPVMFAAPSPPEPLARPLEPLTRNQLLQAFNYLLRSDPDFINKLHEAYVKSFSEILS